ncbi:hypothetical protein EXIGLDRAFT_370888 [Exidia glandulosa HHB12029]|uniref:phytol kinase n=1 Tax=Exidia glandulosa HHB12029 TaxID=1314781 RepID=A0A165C1I0_EXIGL|nr:hypothetical protein EXIGLDRAFT_370888 [Exidia glandulosa HHB12029]
MARLISVDIAQVTAGLRDFQSPIVCVSCLASIITNCVPSGPDEPSQYLANLRRNHGELMNAALSYIITESRLDDEKLALRRPLALWILQCTMPTRDSRARAEHQRALDVLATGVLHADVELFCALLSHCVYSARRDSTQRFSRHLWPTKPGDLLPAGHEGTMRALCVWLQRLDSIEIARTVLGVYRACNVELHPHDAMLIDALVVAVESTSSTLLRMSSSARTGHSLSLLTQQLDELVALLSEVGPEPMRHCCSDIPLLRRVTAAIDLALDVATTHNTVALLVRMGQVLHSTSTCDPPLAPLHRRIQEELASQNSTLSSLQCLYGIIFVTYQRRACGRPACSVTERETGRKLSLCAGCRIIRYCSQDCQKQHWRSSHKSVCSALGKLFAATDISKFSEGLSESTFVTACQAAEFSDDDVSAICSSYLRIPYGRRSAETSGRNCATLGVHVARAIQS